MSLSLCTATPFDSLLRGGGSGTQAMCHLVEVSVRVGQGLPLLAKPAPR